MILKHIDATKFVFLSVFTIIATICIKNRGKSLSKNEKRPFSVDVHCSKTPLLKLNIVTMPAVMEPGRFHIVNVLT